MKINQYFFSIKSIFSFLKILVRFFFMFTGHCLTLTGLLLSFYTVSFLLVYRHEVIVLIDWSLFDSMKTVIDISTGAHMFIMYFKRLWVDTSDLILNNNKKNVFLIIISIKLKSLLYDSLSKANLNCYVAIVSSSNKRHPKCVHMYICICMNDLCSCVSAFF